MRKDIIIIDDDRDLCTLLQESLLQENICADISCNGFDGIKSVKDKEYQLVVLDVMMPGISGFEVLERIRDMLYLWRSPHCPSRQGTHGRNGRS